MTVTAEAQAERDAWQLLREVLGLWLRESVPLRSEGTVASGSGAGDVVARGGLASLWKRCGSERASSVNSGMLPGEE